MPVDNSGSTRANRALVSSTKHFHAQKMSSHTVQGKKGNNQSNTTLQTPSSNMGNV